MKTLLQHLIPAVLSVDKPTIFTLAKLLIEPTKKGAPSGYDLLKPTLRIPRDEHEWFQTRFYQSEYASTRPALRARVDGFTADHRFKRMFKNHRAKVRMFDLLQQPNVILINANRGVLKGAVQDFGRYFIGAIRQAIEDRMLIAKSAKLPVYFYIDEATDYIAEEPKIRDIVNEGRKQFFALTVAQQREGDTTNAQVKAALQDAAIQVRPFDEGERAHISLSRGSQITVSMPRVNFTGRMSGLQWDALLDKMRDRFCEPYVDEPVDDGIIDAEFEDVTDKKDADSDGPHFDAT